MNRILLVITILFAFNTSCTKEHICPGYDLEYHEMWRWHLFSPHISEYTYAAQDDSIILKNEHWHITPTSVKIEGGMYSQDYNCRPSFEIAFYGHPWTYFESKTKYFIYPELNYEEIKYRFFSNTGFTFNQEVWATLAQKGRINSEGKLAVTTNKDYDFQGTSFSQMLVFSLEEPITWEYFQDTNRVVNTIDSIWVAHDYGMAGFSMNGKTYKRL